MDVNEYPAAARSEARLAAWLTLIGVLSLLNFLGNASADPPDDFVYRWSSVVLALVQFALMLGLVLAIAGRDDPRAMLGLRRPHSWPRALGLGFALIVAVFIVAAALSPLLQPGEEQGLVPEGWDSSRAPQFAANFLVIAFFVPLVEELLFRGVGYTLLLRFGEVAAVVGIGVGFALIHGIVEGLPIFFVFGAGLAYLRQRTGSVLPCVAVHGAFNAFSLTIAVLA